MTMDYELSTMGFNYYALKGKIPTSVSGCKDRKIELPETMIFQFLINADLLS
jgi:hypothetical protein